MCQVVATVDEADEAGGEPRAAKAPRLDPAVELEALRRRVHALEHENERLRGAAAGVLGAAAAARSSPSSSEGTVDAPRPLRGHGLCGAQIRCRPSHDVGTIIARCEAFDPIGEAYALVDARGRRHSVRLHGPGSLRFELVAVAPRFRMQRAVACCLCVDAGATWRTACCRHAICGACLDGIERQRAEFDRSVAVAPPPSGRACPFCGQGDEPVSGAADVAEPVPRPRLRALRPLHGTVARIGIGRAHQAEVPMWQHGDAPPAPDRGDERVEVGEAAASAAGATDPAVAADALGSQRAAFNAQVLGAEPRRRWPDAGARCLALGPTPARELLAYVRDPANRNARGRLCLDDGKGTLLGGYGNYHATHAVEAGARHSEAEQVQHTLLLSHDVLDLARDALPGLDALVEGALRKLPEAEVDGRALVPLHGHILDQGSGTARFADHQDTEEEVAKGARAPDRRVVYTAVIALSDGGDTAMRILGHEELAFTGEAGSGAAFRSELWHRTERASAGVWKLALFYGYLL